MQGGSCFLSSSSLASKVNGILLANPTLKNDGSYQLMNWGTRWNVIKGIIAACKVQMSKRYVPACSRRSRFTHILIIRLDFVPLTMEVLTSSSARTGWGMARFVKFCKTFKFVGWVTSDNSFVDIGEILPLPVNAVGPMGLLQHKYFV